MIRILLLALVALAMLLPMTSLAQADDDKPTVALLRYGPVMNTTIVQQYFLSSLHSAGLISDAEAQAGLDIGQDLEGERINITVGDADFDISNVNFFVENALDQGVDALVTFSTPVTLAALNATLDMDDPPILLFAQVYSPYEAGIAQSNCVKPAHVSGVLSVTDYADIVPLLLLQNSEIQTIGTVYSASETSGRLGAAEIASLAGALGLTVHQAAVNSVADLTPAAEGLIAKGVEAFLIPSDVLTVAGLPVLNQVAVENGVLIFHSTGNTFNVGATVSAGASEASFEGRVLAALLAGHLDGSRDISRTGISSVRNLLIGVNLDTAELQGVDISEALLERADAVLEDGVLGGRKFVQEVTEALDLDPETGHKVAAAIQQAAAAGGDLAGLDLPDKLLKIVRSVAADGVAPSETSTPLAWLHCTDEIISEQRAELDAMDG